mgnify:FL=1
MVKRRRLKGLTTYERNQTENIRAIIEDTEMSKRQAPNRKTMATASEFIEAWMAAHNKDEDVQYVCEYLSEKFNRVITEDSAIARCRRYRVETKRRPAIPLPYIQGENSSSSTDWTKMLSMVQKGTKK